MSSCDAILIVCVLCVYDDHCLIISIVLISCVVFVFLLVYVSMRADNCRKVVPSTQRLAIRVLGLKSGRLRRLLSSGKHVET